MGILIAKDKVIITYQFPQQEIQQGNISITEPSSSVVINIQYWVSMNIIVCGLRLNSIKNRVRQIRVENQIPL